MKKILVVLSACFVMASCQWWHETFDSPAECCVCYLEELREAYKENESSRVDELSADYEEWFNGLDEQEQIEAGAAMFEWIGEHPEVFEDMEEDDYMW